MAPKNLAMETDPAADFVYCSNYANQLLQQDRHFETVYSIDYISIHELFQRNKFGALFDYDAMIPALRLASALLRTPGSLAFFYALGNNASDLFTLFGQNPTQYNNFELQDGYRLTMNQEIQAQSDLKTLAQTLQFDVSAGEDRFCATTVPQPSINANQHSFLSPQFARFRGKASTILLSIDECQDISEAYKWECMYSKGPLHSSFSFELLNRYFIIAKTMCHEVAHAFSGAKHTFHDEPCFSNAAFGEVGYSWEWWIFGGILDVQEGPQHAPAFFTFNDARAPLMTADYLILGFAMAVFQRPERIHTLWRVPPAYIAQFFQDDFWRNMVVTGGHAAFLPPRVLGLRRVSKYHFYTYEVPEQWKRDLMPEKRQELAPGTRDDCLGTTAYKPDDWVGPNAVDVEGVPDGYLPLTGGSLIAGHLAMESYEIYWRQRVFFLANGYRSPDLVDDAFAEFEEMGRFTE